MRNRRRKRLITAIMLMLVLSALCVGWIWNREVNRHSEKAAEAAEHLIVAIKTGIEELEESSERIRDIPPALHVYSHRGSMGFYEHSVRTYDEAVKAGSLYIEQDLVISADGVLFVAHDMSAQPMTGVSALYSDMNAADIDELSTHAGYKVLRLSEVFDRYGRSVNYLIELKASDSETIEAFEDIVDEYGFQDIVTVQSLYTGVLERIEEKYPDMPKLLVCKTQAAFEEGLASEDTDILSVRFMSGLMTAGNCEAAHRRGKLFSAWNLDYGQDIRNAIDMGVDTYFTNDTPLALSVEKEYGLAARNGK